MLLASLWDLIVVASLAAGGVLMSPFPIRGIGVLVVTTLAFTNAMDTLNLAVFAHLRID